MYLGRQAATASSGSIPQADGGNLCDFSAVAPAAPNDAMAHAPIGGGQGHQSAKPLAGQIHAVRVRSGTAAAGGFTAQQVSRCDIGSVPAVAAALPDDPARGAAVRFFDHGEPAVPLAGGDPLSHDRLRDR